MFRARNISSLFGKVRKKMFRISIVCVVYTDFEFGSRNPKCSPLPTKEDKNFIISKAHILSGWSLLSP
jgi:hypothetical protein